MVLNRRSFLYTAAAPLLAGRSAGRPPNILLILAESLGAWTLGCYGAKEIHTPSLDRLAHGGVRFSHHVVSAPEAAPSTATLLTGLLPRQHGAGEKREVSGGVAMISTLFARAGYNCGFVGQWALGGVDGERHGFGYWQPQQGFPTQSAVEFLARQKPGQPFFLLACYPAIRPPYEGHAQKYYDLYARSQFEGLGWLPAAANAAGGAEYLKDVPASLRKAAAEISALDGELGVVLPALDRQGLWGDTLVVFTAACGHLMGRHGLWGAGRASNPVNMYDESVMTPLIWNWPGRLPVQGVRPEIVGGDDLLPSLCEAAGVPLPQGQPLAGQSYLALAANRPLAEKKPWRSLAFSELDDTAMARDSRFKVVVRGEDNAAGEFYDMRLDPRETTNRFSAGEYITVRDALIRQIAAWRKQYA